MYKYFVPICNGFVNISNGNVSFCILETLYGCGVSTLLTTVAFDLLNISFSIDGNTLNQLKDFTQCNIPIQSNKKDITNVVLT